MTPPPGATDIQTTSDFATCGVEGLTPEIGVTRRAERPASSLWRRLFDREAWVRLRLLVDLVVTYLATCAAVFASKPMRVVPSERWIAALFPVLIVALLHLRRGPDDRLTASRLETFIHVMGVVSLGAMTTLAADSAVGGAHPVGLALRLWIFTAVYLGTSRVMLLSLRRQAMRSGAVATPTLIVGAGQVGERLARRLAAEPTYGLRPVGFLDSDPGEATRDQDGQAIPVLGGIDDLRRALDQTGAKRVILAFSSDPDWVLVDKVRECHKQGVEVSLVPRLYEAISESATLDHLGGVPLVSLRPVDPDGWQFAVKHAFDRIIATLALLAMAPLVAAIAIAVRLSSPGPVLFRQRRIGRDGRAFDLLKFRTMRMPPADERFEPPEGCAPGGVEGVDRRTAVGTFLRNSSLDELPQLLNVLRGEMSLIGPRPERPQFVRRFSLEVDRYEDRHRVKSGITGWAQVNGLRGQTSIADRVEWDNYYIQNWSLGFDFRIIALTVSELLRFRG